MIEVTQVSTSRGRNTQKIIKGMQPRGLRVHFSN